MINKFYDNINKMHCIHSCLIGCGLLGAMLFTMLYSSRNSNQAQFVKLLDSRQKEIYNSIIQERLKIYICGYIVGLILATLVVFSLKSNSMQNICVFVTIATGVNYLYYVIHPKSNYMLNHLTSVEQNKAWLKIYRNMKRNYIIGFMLGVLGYLFLGRAFC